MFNNKNQKGFTLIELLIVIVIIGILAGVLIAVINPVQQQNRAKDAGVKATMNKVALATEGFISAYGRAPNDIEFIASLSNATAWNATSCVGAAGAGDQVCLFQVDGNALPIGGTNGCGTTEATAWTGSAAARCYFKYYQGDPAADAGHFRIYAKSFGITQTIFLYDNGLGEIIECRVADGVADGDGETCDGT